MSKPTRKATGPAAPQGEAAPDPRIITDPAAHKLFRYTQLTGPYVQRADINPAPYNPRSADTGTLKRLRDGLKRHGLVNRLVWNARNGVLVGGHQRLKGMDALMGYPKDCPTYLVPVDIINVDDTKEREINVLLNNPSIQGTYDTDALQHLFENGANPWNTGFDRLELEFMFGQDLTQQLADTFLPSESEEDDAPRTTPTKSGEGDHAALTAEAEKINALKERRKIQTATDQGEDSPDHVLHIVYPNTRTLETFLKRHGINPNERYITAERYQDAIETDLTGDEL